MYDKRKNSLFKQGNFPLNKLLCEINSGESMKKVGGILLLVLAVGIYLFVAIRALDLLLFTFSVELTSYVIGNIAGSLTVLILLAWLATKSLKKGLVISNLKKL